MRWFGWFRRWRDTPDYLRNQVEILDRHRTGIHWNRVPGMQHLKIGDIYRLMTPDGKEQVGPDHLPCLPSCCAIVEEKPVKVMPTGWSVQCFWGSLDDLVQE